MIDILKNKYRKYKATVAKQAIQAEAALKIAKNRYEVLPDGQRIVRPRGGGFTTTYSPSSNTYLSTDAVPFMISRHAIMRNCRALGLSNPYMQAIKTMWKALILGDTGIVFKVVNKVTEDIVPDANDVLQNWLDEISYDLVCFDIIDKSLTDTEVFIRFLDNNRIQFVPPEMIQTPGMPPDKSSEVAKVDLDTGVYDGFKIVDSEIDGFYYTTDGTNFEYISSDDMIYMPGVKIPNSLRSYPLTRPVMEDLNGAHASTRIGECTIDAQGRIIMIRSWPNSFGFDQMEGIAENDKDFTSSASDRYIEVGKSGLIYDLPAGAELKYTPDLIDVSKFETMIYRMLIAVAAGSGVPLASFDARQQYKSVAESTERLTRTCFKQKSKMYAHFIKELCLTFLKKNGIMNDRYKLIYTLPASQGKDWNDIIRSYILLYRNKLVSAATARDALNFDSDSEDERIQAEASLNLNPDESVPTSVQGERFDGVGGSSAVRQKRGDV